MLIYPAIDLYEGKAVRLLKGDYNRMTVYSEYPPEIAEEFVKAGATHIHVVDLEGARDGGTPNLETVLAIKEAAARTAAALFSSSSKSGDSGSPCNDPDTPCCDSATDKEPPFVEIGGGIRDKEMVARYLDAGIDRVILGTAAVKDPEFLKWTAGEYGERAAVGIDIRDGFVAVKGWTELSEYRLEEFAHMMQDAGVKTIICTDISRDGAMRGTNRELYKKLSESLDIDIVASGGVSSLDDVKALASLGIHGAIIGKAYYTGAIDLEEAVKIAMAKSGQ